MVKKKSIKQQNELKALKDIIEIPVRVIIKNNVPGIELRKSITDMETIKSLVTSTFYEEGRYFIPRFSNKAASINSLIEKGIAYRDEEGTLRFTVK